MLALLSGWKKVITMYSLSKELLCFGLGNYLHINTRESQREKYTHITFVSKKKVLKNLLLLIHISQTISGLGRFR